MPIVVTSSHDFGSTGRQHLLLVTDKYTVGQGGK